MCHEQWWMMFVGIVVACDQLYVVLRSVHDCSYCPRGSLFTRPSVSVGIFPSRKGRHRLLRGLSVGLALCLCTYSA